MFQASVLFVHHRAGQITHQNLASFRSQNPNIPVIALSTDEVCEGGISIADSQEAWGIWSHHIATTGMAAKSTDLIFCLWYQFLRRPEQHAQRWFIVEWDTYCNIPVEEFCKEVWDFPISGANTVWPSLGGDWESFKHTPSLPEKFQPFACGIVPMSCILVQDWLLSRIVEEMPWNQLGTTNGKNRLATLAAYCGALVGVNPRVGPFITWRQLTVRYGLHEARDMFHAFKTLYPYIDPAQTPHKEHTDFLEASIWEDNYNWLVLFAKAEGVQNVVEFGPGDSTLATRAT
jgi:hypothetical protein